MNIATAVSLILGAGGLVVGVAGFVLNRKAIGDEWAREWAAQRPLVYPVAPREWVDPGLADTYKWGNQRVIPLKNGGRGPALNVRGEVHVTTTDGSQYFRDIYAGTIAAGDEFDARVTPYPGVLEWSGAYGVLRYSDLAKGGWETRFEFVQDPNGELELIAYEPIPTGTVVERGDGDPTRFGDPPLPPESASQRDPTTAGE